jgi:hypothetical protein
MRVPGEFSCPRLKRGSHLLQVRVAVVNRRDVTALGMTQQPTDEGLTPDAE